MNNPRSRSIFARSLLGTPLPKTGECARLGWCQYMAKELHLTGDCFSKYCSRYPTPPAERKS